MPLFLIRAQSTNRIVALLNEADASDAADALMGVWPAQDCEYALLPRGGIVAENPNRAQIVPLLSADEIARSAQPDTHTPEIASAGDVFQGGIDLTMNIWEFLTQSERRIAWHPLDPEGLSASSKFHILSLRADGTRLIEAIWRDAKDNGETCIRARLRATDIAHHLPGLRA